MAKIEALQQALADVKQSRAAERGAMVVVGDLATQGAEAATRQAAKSVDLPKRGTET